MVNSQLLIVNNDKYFIVRILFAPVNEKTNSVGGDMEGRTRQKTICLPHMRIILTCVSISIFFLVSLGIGTVSASTSFVGDKVVSPNTAYAMTIIMPTTGGLDFAVDVHSGPNIDIVLVDGDNYQKFMHGEAYTYYKGGTFNDSSHAVGAAWLEAGTYYLIFSNDGSSSATVHYEYTPTTISNGGVGNSAIDIGWIVIGCIIVVAVIVAISFLFAHKQGSNHDKISIRGKTENDKNGEAGNGVRFCHNCGNRLTSDDAYCRTCGIKL